MAMVTHNGQSIGIAEYVSLIIETARKIIEKEQREKANLDKSGLSLASADAPEDRSASVESEITKEMEETTSNSLDTNLVMVRLPDGTLKSVEDYIIGIIKDASSQIERERQNASTLADDTVDQRADDKNMQTPTKTTANNTCEKDSTPKAATPRTSSQRSGAVSKVLGRIFKRSKTKEKEKPNEGIINGFDDSPAPGRASEEKKPSSKSEPCSYNSVHSDEITAHSPTENHDSPNKDNKQIPKGKGKLKKKNSLRNMLSCFSSKAAQAD